MGFDLRSPALAPATLEEEAPRPCFCQGETGFGGLVDLPVGMLDLKWEVFIMGCHTKPARKKMIINKAFRLAVSLPIYAASALMWIPIAITTIKSGAMAFKGYLTPYQVGEVLGNLLICLVVAALSVGLWLLGRYVRTSTFKRARKQAAVNQL